MVLKSNLSKITKTFSDNASNVASNVAKKSGELVEKSKYLSAMAQDEKKIKEFYKNIGERVYNKYEQQSFEDVDLADLFEKTKSLKNHYEEVKEKLNELNDTKECKNCGFEIDNEYEFCPKCGSKQGKAEKKEEFVEAEIVPKCDGTECNFRE
ncbi:MAG: hypothetical protein ACERKV_01585 [Clostridiaceae bacterium]